MSEKFVWNWSVSGSKILHISVVCGIGLCGSESTLYLCEVTRQPQLLHEAQGPHCSPG